MSQKKTDLSLIQVPGGSATPAPPVGPALGQHGVNIERQALLEIGCRLVRVGADLVLEDPAQLEVQPRIAR